MQQRLTIAKKVASMLLMSFTIIFTLNGCFTTTSGDPLPGSGGSKIAPTPIFSYSVGLNGSVSFINLSLNATEYEWDFGDFSSSSFTMNPQHQYTSNDTYTVTLTATGPGGTKTTSNAIVISGIQGTITYKNTAQTPITITINGQTQIIQPTASFAFSGTPNSSASGSAFTSGATTSGTQIGAKITWNFNDTFPSNGKTIELYVNSSYFFLKLKNSWTYPISKVFINYSTVSQSVDNITIPNDGVTYSIGYYLAYSNSNIRVENGAHFWYSDLFLSADKNSVGTVEVK